MSPRPKHTAIKPFTVGSHSFAVGDPVLGGRPLELGLKHGYVKSDARRSKSDGSAVLIPETPLPDSPAETPKENPS